MASSSTNIEEIHSNQVLIERTDEEYLRKQATLIRQGMAFHMTLKSAMELGLLNIIAEAGDGAYLSASEVAGRVVDGPLRPSDAPALLDRMMALLATFSVLKCKLVESNDGFNRRYGTTPLTKYFLTEVDPGSRDGNVKVMPYLLQLEKVMLDSWNELTKSLREGGQPFERVHGMSMYEYAGTDPKFNLKFNRTVSKATSLIMNKVLDVYEGFEGINTLVDVGGGIGTNLNLIMSRYPDIVKGISYDLPHVVADAPKYNNGVEHIAGDMFEKVPNGDVIFLKWILHNWSDEHCLKLFKNCWKALPSSGKVVIVESILPSVPNNELESQLAHLFDMVMMVNTSSGKERTEQDFKALATKSGFSGFKVCCSAHSSWVMEFHK